MKARPRREYVLIAKDEQARLFGMERVAKRLAELYLANATWPRSRGKFPQPHEFVTCVTPPRGGAIHGDWRELWELTHKEAR